jgi:hypothetical protein
MMCSNCGGPFAPSRPPTRKGWCSACYQRWLKGGKPAGPPPLPRLNYPRGGGKGRLARMETFRELDVRPGQVNQYGVPYLPDREIARIVGVSRRTIWRYRRAGRDAGTGWYKPSSPEVS